jgi:hypothetical protein
MNEHKRRILVPAACIVLAAYYFLVFLPLSRRAGSYDAPLLKSWRSLAATLEAGHSNTIDFIRITNQLSETRQSLAALEDAKKQTATRLELSSSLRARLLAPFQLVDYENERGKQMDELIRAAGKQKIALDPAVLEGFPEHTTDIREPALLWAALAFTDELLGLAVACKVSAIHSLEVPLTMTNSPASEVPGRWAEIPVQIEFTAPAEKAFQLIQSLPLRAEEARAAGLPATSPDRTPFFVDRLMIKKQSSEKLEDVHVWLRAVSFVARE